MPVANVNKKTLRTLGHHLKPVVTVAGKGLSDSVVAELQRALEDHELIKVKFAIFDRAARKAAIAQICSDLQAELIQHIGKVTLIFRPADKPDLRTSNLHK